MLIHEWKNNLAAKYLKNNFWAKIPRNPFLIHDDSVNKINSRDGQIFVTFGKPAGKVYYARLNNKRVCVCEHDCTERSLRSEEHCAGDKKKRSLGAKGVNKVETKLSVVHRVSQLVFLSSRNFDLSANYV